MLNSQRLRWSEIFVFTLLFALVIFVRVYGLDLKPIHFDEGINGNFVHQMWHDGFYRYDPTNFHGPLYFYILQWTELTFGFGIVAYRFVTGLLSLASIYLIARHSRFFGRAAIWAAAIYGLSAASAFYSRYAIHESLFILGQVMFTYGFFLWLEQRSRAALSWMMAGLVIDVCTKETFFIFFVTWAIACVCTRVSEKIALPKTGLSIRVFEGLDQIERRRDLVTLAILGATAIALLFSGFFLNPAGISSFFAAFAHWAQTGVGQKTGHEKPFFYWLKLLWLYEWPSLLALIAAPLLAFSADPRRRLIAIAAIGCWLAYSLIPYKTPWLILNFTWLLAFVAAFAFEEFFSQSSRLVRAAGLILAVVVGYQGVNAMTTLCFRDYAKLDEPYVYVQTTMDVKHLADIVQARVADHPEDIAMRIAVIARDPWPFPYIFAPFRSVSWGRVGDFVERTSDGRQMDVIVIDSGDQAELEKKLSGAYWVMPFRLRDSYGTGFVYFGFDRFKGYVSPEWRIFRGGAR